MECFSLIHKELSKGLQVIDDHVFFGQTGDSCKSYRLQLDKDNPPEIKDGVIYNAFSTIDQSTERPKLIKADRNSSTVMLRIYTGADTGRPISKIRGKWFNTGSKQEAICTGYGFKRSWADSLITLRSGNAVIVTIEGGGKLVVLNHEGRIICAEVTQQHFFENRHYKSKRQRRKEYEETKSQENVETEALPSETKQPATVAE
jgi:hypothetical protein